MAKLSARHGTRQSGATVCRASLQEISPKYWQHHTGLTRPDAKQVIELLSTQRFLDFHSVEENDDSIDFSLPENVTDYVLCVSFDEDGNVEDISMES